MHVLNEYTSFIKYIKSHNTYDKEESIIPEYIYKQEVDARKILELMPEIIRGNYKCELDFFEHVLLWIKQNIPYDGYSQYEVSYDAVSIIKSSREQKKGSNCMMLAFVLRDILEAYGYLSRVIQACPFDPSLQDSHWQVLVYSKMYQKWVMLDPTWGAYCIENSIPLSISQIRQLIASQKKFEIKNCSGLSVGNYHYLLCRYYFHFNAFLYNGVGMFECEEQKRINLSPKGYDAKLYFKTRFHLDEPELEKWIKRYLVRFDENTIYITNEKNFWNELDT